MTNPINDLENLGSVRSKLNEVVGKTNGSTPMQVSIAGGAINGTAIGQGTPALGAFTGLAAQSLNVANQATLGSAVLSGPIGAGGTNYGTAGQALLSNGPAAAPSWGTPIPSGVIVMWSGSIASIPAGWALCNGSNGTPDLRDRFIVGAGQSYPVGNTGGAASVTLSAFQIPPHNHSFSGTTSVNGLHAHAGGAANVGIFSQTGDASQNVQPIVSNTSVEGAHSHTFSGITDATGSGAAHENRPPYLALAYIMKT